MPNIASVLKEEIVRLARKEVRAETESLKKASAHFRSDIAGLKKRVSALEKQLAHAEKKAAGKASSSAATAGATRTRFSAKGLATQRQKLGLAAADMGALLGVSAQTIYNWEAGKSKPRAQQLAAIASLRGMGKRKAKAQLATLADSSPE
jgi:DNA-binding transcriptional regulator YiaG